MKLREIRLHKKLSVPELSRRSGVPVRTIENIEKVGECRLSSAIKLSEALNVTLGQLAGLEERTPEDEG